MRSSNNFPVSSLAGIGTSLQSAIDLPDALVKLRQALEKCTRSRQVQDTVLAVFKALDPLREGIEMLGIMESELNDAAVEAVRRAVDVQGTR